MKFVKKLNVVSIIYAFMLFVNIELMLNVYRISRITGWDLDTVVVIISTIKIVGFIFCTIFFYKLIKNLMEGRKASFFTIILWFPYFIFFIYIFASLFPITYGGDKPNPINGLVILGELILYPIYLAILNFIVISFSNTAEEK